MVQKMTPAFGLKAANPATTKCKNITKMVGANGGNMVSSSQQLHMQSFTGQSAHLGKGQTKKEKKTGKRWTSKNKCSHKVVKGKRNKKKSTDADKNPTTWAKWVAAPQQHFQKAEKGTEETKKKKERNRRCSGPR